MGGVSSLAVEYAPGEIRGIGGIKNIKTLNEMFRFLPHTQRIEYDGGWNAAATVVIFRENATFLKDFSTDDMLYSKFFFCKSLQPTIYLRSHFFVNFFCYSFFFFLTHLWIDFDKRSLKCTKVQPILALSQPFLTHSFRNRFW